VCCVAGCFAPEPQPGLPCSDEDRCPSGLECDLVTRTCEDPAALLTWRVDTAADFATPTAVFEDAAVEAAGAIGPTPYYVEGVRISGIEGAVIPPLIDVNWDSVASMPIAGRGFFRSLDVSFGSDPPPGVGLAELADDVTVLVEGEIYFDAGDYEIELECNDEGFVEFAAPRSTAFQLVATSADNPNVATLTAPVAGWYPFRGAFEDAGGSMWFELLADDAGGNPTTIPRSRIRARVDDLGGFSLDGFDEPLLVNPMTSTLVDEPLDLAFGDVAPEQAPEIGNAEFSLRFAGQVLVDADGMYTLVLDTQGGHRWWIDGVEVADVLTTAPQRSEVTVMLDRGWHDMVIDTGKQGNSDAHISLAVESGPSLAGAPFPVDHVRPAIGRAVRWAEAHLNSGVAIPDAGNVSKSLSVSLPPDAASAFVDFDWRVDHMDLPSLSVTLTPPGSPPVILAAAGSMTGTMTYRNDHHVEPGVAGSPWVLTATDTELADTIAGTFAFARMSMTYGGGLEPFPLAYRYESEVRDLGSVTGIRELRWSARQVVGAGRVAVRIRTCDTPDACAAEPWTDAPSGQIPAVAARRYAQFEVSAITDGNVPTAFELFELDYRVAP
jgi:hypothetical protein